MTTQQRAPNRPGLVKIFLVFQIIAMQSFGGVLPIARRDLVEKHEWLSADEFTELLGICQFLPGPNISNLSIAVGKKLQGSPGALCAMAGLYALPLLICLLIAKLYQALGDVSMLHDSLSGIASVAAGLITAMAIKMFYPLWQSRRWTSLLLCLATVILIGLLRLPFLTTLPLLALLSIGISWREIR